MCIRDRSEAIHGFIPFSLKVRLDNTTLHTLSFVVNSAGLISALMRFIQPDVSQSPSVLIWCKCFFVYASVSSCFCLCVCRGVFVLSILTGFVGYVQENSTVVFLMFKNLLSTFTGFVGCVQENSTVVWVSIVLLNWLVWVSIVLLHWLVGCVQENSPVVWVSIVLLHWLVGCVQENSTVVCLNLSKNKIEIHGGRHIGAALSKFYDL